MNSKAKGSEAERKICKFLSKWLSGSEKPYQFWRTSNSGATSSVVKENIHMTGDITAITPDARWFTDLFSIEVKTGYKDAETFKILKKGKPSDIENFWQQCCKDAKRANKYPMLIFNKKNSLTVVGIDRKLEDFFPDKEYNLKYVSMRFHGDNGEKYLPDLYFYNFDEFFYTIKPDDMRKINAKT